MPKRFGDATRWGLIVTLFALVCCWALVDFLFIWMRSSDASIAILAVQNISQRPGFAWVVFLGLMVSILCSVLIPTLYLLRDEHLGERIFKLAERVSVLSVFYFFLDFVGILIVIWRNL